MPQVKIYTTRTCTYCKLAKRFFARYGIPYEELDVALDAKAREEMISKSHQLGVPVIDVDGQVFIGFNRAELAKKLKVA